LAVQLYEGLLPLALEYNTAIAGGDTNTWVGPLVIAVTLLGEPAEKDCLTRAGALPGDEILVTGAFGGSILGRHFDFEPRVNEALQLHRCYGIHAATDVSDGLSLDLWHICQESGCGAELALAAIPVHEDARRLARQRGDSVSPLDHALGDGEDFELVLAVPPDEAERLLKEQPLRTQLTRIGRFISESGLFAIDSSGTRRPISPAGYRH
jgi:thiamine-monophosphate kinase